MTMIRGELQQNQIKNIFVFSKKSIKNKNLFIPYVKELINSRLVC